MESLMVDGFLTADFADFFGNNQKQKERSFSPDLWFKVNFCEFLQNRLLQKQDSELMLWNWNSETKSGVYIILSYKTI